MRPVSMLAVLSWTLLAGAGEAGKKVEFDTDFKAYFVKNNAPVKDNPAYLVLTDKKEFDQVFGVGFTMKKPKTIDPKAFDAKIVVAVIKRGNAATSYTVQQVSAKNGELRVEYQAMEGKAGSATFASPLLVVADGRDYTRVVFVESGKEVAKVNVKKGG
jgi:hypothetical protein